MVYINFITVSFFLKVLDYGALQNTPNRYWWKIMVSRYTARYFYVTFLAKKGETDVSPHFIYENAELVVLCNGDAVAPTSLRAYM